MTIPPFEPATGYLPPGLYDADIHEIRRKLGFSPRRRALVSNLEEVANALFAAGVTDLRIDGSFVTEKPEPGDIDGFWVWNDSVRMDDIPTVLQDFSLVPDPATGKPKFPMWYQYGIELYIHPFMGGLRQGDLPEFFSHSRDGVERGYIRVVPFLHGSGG